MHHSHLSETVRLDFTVSKSPLVPFNSQYVPETAQKVHALSARFRKTRRYESFVAC